MDDEIISTSEAAKLLGVGTTTIKRWSDTGVLQCVKTPGKHRRFLRRDVESLLHGDKPVEDEPSAELVTLLLGDASVHDLYQELLANRARLSAWWRVAEALGEALADLGAGWRRGEVTVLQEHIASDKLVRALQQVSANLPLAPTAPRALLATAAGEEHTLGLSLAELCIKEAGVVSTWAGRFTPAEEISRALENQPFDFVLISASAYNDDSVSLQAQASLLGDACHKVGAALILGGNGAWPESPQHAHRLRSFGELATLLASRRMPARPGRGPWRD